MMFWLNGQPAQQLPLADRSIHYGDGCFTTARVHAGSVQLFEQHMQRLQENASLLLITDIPWSLLIDEIKQAAAALEQGVIKVILTRGASGRGYAMDSARQQPARIISTSPYPQHYQKWREQGVRLQLSPIKLGINPHLAGIKHLNRLEQVLIRSALTEDAQEVVVLDSDGMIVECCAANLFWRKEDSVYTPLLDRAGVKGVMRQHIIQLLTQFHWQVKEVRAPFETVAEADEIWICNSLMPLLPVQQIGAWRYDSVYLYNILLPHCF